MSLFIVKVPQLMVKEVFLIKPQAVGSKSWRGGMHRKIIPPLIAGMHRCRVSFWCVQNDNTLGTTRVMFPGSLYLITFSKKHVGVSIKCSWRWKKVLLYRLCLVIGYSTLLHFPPIAMRNCILQGAATDGATDQVPIKHLGKGGTILYERPAQGYYSHKR